MRKTFVPLVLAVAIFAMVSPASAIWKTGFHVGIDKNGHDPINSEFGADIGTPETITLLSHEIKDPILGGVHLIVDALPFLDFEMGLEGSYAKYKYEYQVSELSPISQDASFGRLSIYASGKFNYITLPMVRLYIGAGAGYHLITPLFGTELVEQELESQSDYDLDLANMLSRKTHFGYHVLGGVGLSPVFLPFDLNVEARYFILPQNEFEDDTNKFMSITLGLNFGS
ncbi:hypothetical protein H8E52_05395 [bacterium]|nr:hypothetical protein [bacterium]